MNNRERFNAIMGFKPVDRHINFEIGPWDQTADRWIGEGLPEGRIFPLFTDEKGTVTDDYFGLDCFQAININMQDSYPFNGEKIVSEDDRTIIYIDSRGVKRKGLKVGKSGNTSLSMDQFLEYPVKDKESFLKWKKRFEEHYGERYPENWEEKKKEWRARDYPLWAPGGGQFGFHGFSMNWIGIENLAFVMYDNSALIEEIFDFWTEYAMGLLKKALKEAEIDFYQYFEDMACKTGPLVSPANVKKYFVPRYKKINSFLRKNGVKYIFVDCDGNIEDLIPLFIESGIDGIMPIESAAGMDVVKLRKKYGKDLLLWGNIDKREIAKDKRAIESELKYKASIIEEGGYIPCIDHSIPPDTSLENFKYYLKLKEKVLGIR